MKKASGIILLASVISTSLMSASVMADTVESDAVMWNVTAVKDGDARLVVTPNGLINFQYEQETQDFNSSSAPFHIEVNGSGLTASSFTLEAKKGSSDLVVNGSSTMTVDLLANGEELTTGDYVTLVDESTSMDGLDNITGLGDEAETGEASFTAMLSDFVVDGTATNDASTLPDGTFTGAVSAQFRATWTEDSGTEGGTL